MASLLRASLGAAQLSASDKSSPSSSPPAASSVARLNTAFVPSLPSSFSSSCSSGSLGISRRKQQVAIQAITPGFYKIPVYPGVPVGSTMKLYNMPYDIDREAVIEHFKSIGATVESLEITNCPEENNAHGIITLGDLDQCCWAKVHLDGAKFQGMCLRMDFVNKRPYDPEPPRRSRMNRAYQNNYNSYGGNTTSTGNYGVNATNTASYNYGGDSSSYTGDTGTYSRMPITANRIYVGNLPWRADESTLQQLFAQHGVVHEVRIMKEVDTGRSRGFGFVTMSTPEEMQAAISALNGHEMDGRQLRVNPAN